jgi:hypothetical protein
MVTWAHEVRWGPYMRSNTAPFLASSFLAVLVSLTASSTLIVGTSGCVGGGCNCSSGDVTVNFATGITSAEVASVTTKTPSVCGPVPSTLCDPNLITCSAASQKTDGFSLDVPSIAAGTCSLEVTLKDGTVFNESVHVSDSSAGGCCSGPGADHAIEIKPKA